MLQVLKHHVLDKYQVRSRGGLVSLYQQSPKGRKMGGGLRFGEMERHPGISWGKLRDVGKTYGNQ